MKDGLAIDIGGTFTDVVLVHRGETFAEKLLTTHDSPSDAVIDGIQAVVGDSAIAFDEIPIILHGTTLATNALIQRSGARTALLTTEGHRDILEMAFENRFEQYDVNIERPAPLVPRHLRIPIKERMNAAGRPLLDLDHDSVGHAINLLKQNEVESVAIGFLHSYANNVHEKSVGSLLSTQLPDVEISLSSEICPEIREYERLSTTCANAYVLPLMKNYLSDLESRIRDLGATCPLLMMTSGGGLTTFETASRTPIRLIESGPAGGAILACELAQQFGLANAVSFDMGGTTAKICLVDDGKALFSRSFEVDRRYRFRRGSGLPVRIPVIEMVEIGAGGGSIAKVDKLDRILIGPQSAGSQPGPACYGLGGVNATVTDADCALGRLQPDRFAGGMLRLDLHEAIRAVNNNIGSALNLSLNQASLGVVEIVDENMAAAARSHAAEWGKSLVGRTLIAFGGAAPLHAARLIEKLDLAAVIVPIGAGVGSALGFLSAPVSYEVVRSRYMILSRYDEHLVQDVLTEMKVEAERVVAPAVDGKPLVAHATAYMRYLGQGYEISVPFDPNDVTKDELQRLYEGVYTELNGRLIPDAEVEVMSWTLTLTTTEAQVDMLQLPEEIHDYEGSFDIADLQETNGKVKARVIEREHLQALQRVIGPALVTERHTTTVIPTGYVAGVLESNALMISRTENE